MAVDRELGAGSWSYFGDPRAISHDGDTFTGWISTTGNVWVARYTRRRAADQARDLQGPRARRPQQPVARLPARRAHHGVLLAALRAPPAAARDPEQDALHGVVEPVLDQRLRAGAHRRHQRPRRPRATRIRTRSSSRTGCGCSGAGATGTRRSPTPTTACTGSRPASSCTSGTAQRPYTKYVGDGNASIHGIFTNGHPTNWKNSLFYMRYETGDLYEASGRRIGSIRSVPLHTTKLDLIYRYSDQRRARVGARHRAHRRGPAARRLHAPGRQPRHLLLRLPQRHEVDQPQDRRGRRRPPVLPLRRRDPRPRGPAHRLPLTHDRAAGTRSSSGSRRTTGRSWTHSS